MLEQIAASKQNIKNFMVLDFCILAKTTRVSGLFVIGITLLKPQ